MRLSFANGEHADFIVNAGTATLGTAEDNALVLASGEVAPRHARISVDARGGVLEVLDPAAQTHLNARPVREMALLRCGDILCLGSSVITIKLDRDDMLQAPVAPASALSRASEPPRVVLRGLSGRHCGKTIAVNPRLVIGRDARCDLVLDDAELAPQHATLEVLGEAIHLRALDASATVSVAGLTASQAVVHAGDQLVFGRSHFIVEAPSLPLRDDDNSRTGQSITAPHIPDLARPESEPAPSARGALWWLIGAAALIALGLVLVLQRGA